MRWVLILVLGIGLTACSADQNPSSELVFDQNPDFSSQVEAASGALGLRPSTALDVAHLAMWDGQRPNQTVSSFSDWATIKLADRAPTPAPLRVPEAAPRRRQGDVRGRPIDLDQSQLREMDRLSIRLVQSALDTKPVRRALFRARDLDLKDQTTEWGGILDWDTDGWMMLSGPGDGKNDDGFFQRPASDFRQMFDGAIPFHLHARALNMSAVAGPGSTDLQAAEEHGVPALVFTSLNKDCLQVDWYRRGGIVVDLGEIIR